MRDPVRAAQPAGIRLSGATAIVIASMVGAGVFTTSGFLLADLGSPGWVLAAWAAGGLVATCGALCYGALARALPGSGGEYHYLARLVHPAAGAVAGWISLLAGFAAPAAAAALGLQAYLAPWLGASAAAAGSAAVLLLAALHAFRVRPGVGAQTGAVIVKLLLLAAFLVMGVRACGGAAIDPMAATAGGASGTAGPAPSLAAFGAALVWVSFSYSGWNAATYLAGEVHDPARTLPRALLLGCGIVTLLYLAFNAIILAAAPPSALAGREDVAAVAAEHLGGGWLLILLRAAAILALCTSISALMQGGPRVVARMAEDGHMPRALAARRADAAPTRAVALQCALALLLLWWTGLRELLGAIGFTLSLCAAATVLALVRLRRARGAAAVPVPGWPFAPAILISASLGAAGFLAWREPRIAAWGAVAIAASLLLYAFARRRPAA